MWRKCTAPENVGKLAGLDCSTGAVPPSVSSNCWLVRWISRVGPALILWAASLLQAKIYFRFQLAWELKRQDKAATTSSILYVEGYSLKHCGDGENK